MRRRLSLLSACAMYALSAINADDRVPDGECACSPHMVLVGRGTSVQYECRWFLMGGAELTLNADPAVSDRRTLDCDNCGEPCNELHCIQSLCVTRTDSGSVSGTGGFSVQLTSEINTLLAGRIEIETTAEFTAGYTSTTEVSTEYCIECGSDSIQPCTATRYALESYRADRQARAPLGHRWYVRTRPYGGDWSEWQERNQCYGAAGYAAINGSKGSTSGCVAKRLKCGPCEVCHPR